MQEMMLLRLQYTNESVKTVIRQGYTAVDREKNYLKSLQKSRGSNGQPLLVIEP